MLGYIKTRTKFHGVEPAKLDTVYGNRDTGGGWEEVEFTDREDKVGVAARFTASDRYLCVTPEGKVETRTAVGGWETFGLAEQLDGTILLHAKRDGVVVAVFEVVKK